MPPVFAQMRRNAVAADLCDNLRRAHRIGMVAAARVPDRRDMVDIDAEAEVAGHVQAFRLPGLTASVAASSGWQFIGRVGREVEFDKRKERHAQIDGARRPVNDRCRCDYFATCIARSP
jgi:hypothetical protein